MTKKAMIILCGLVVAFIIGLGIYYLQETGRHDHPHSQEKVYQCPMHPHIIQENPGKCPICHMHLERKKMDIEKKNPEQDPQKGHVKKDKKILFYRHPMRPDITSLTPKKDEMGMDYIPVYQKEATAHASVDIPLERQQLIGVTVKKARRLFLHRSLRAVGQVSYDPGLYQNLLEYRDIATLTEKNKSLGEAVLFKLRQWGIEKRHLDIFLHSQSAMEGLILPEKAEWITAQFFGEDRVWIKEGLHTEVTIPDTPSQTVYGKIFSIEPVLSQETRTFRVRIRLDQTASFLKPNMVVSVKASIPLGVKLSIPESAILDTGERQIVFVRQNGTEFIPTDVTLGTEGDDYREVLKGIKEGDEVVTEANFLIDSESRFQAAINAFSKKAHDH